MRSLTSMLLGGIREIIFGLEDGLVSTLGVVTGIAEGTQDRFVILLSGIVLVAVESLSMAAGTYLSDKSEEEARFISVAKRALHRIVRLGSNRNGRSIRAALTMGVAYMIGGAVPVLPYALLPVRNAIPISVIATITTLYLVGVGKGKLTRTDSVKSGLEMVLVSLSAAALGFAIGKLASIFFPQINTH